jgi:hypothetical protein
LWHKAWKAYCKIEIMAHAKYIPTSDANKVMWLNNFTIKLNLYASTLGISNTELNSLQNDTALFSYIVNLMELYYTNYLNLAGYKNMMKFAEGQQHLSFIPKLPPLPTEPTLVPEGIFDRVSKLVKRIKASTTYNDHIGSDLGIVAPTESVDVTTMQPNIKITLNVGKPYLKWTKGKAEALDLYVDRNDGQSFTYIGRFLHAEYLDVTDLDPDKIYDEWHYKGIYVKADKQVGLYSKVSSVDLKKM